MLFPLYYNTCLKLLAVLLEQPSSSGLTYNTKRDVSSLAKSASKALAFADLVTARFPVAVAMKDAEGEFFLAIVLAKFIAQFEMNTHVLYSGMNSDLDSKAASPCRSAFLKPSLTAPIRHFRLILSGIASNKSSPQKS
jgi:hypothetical protein